MDCASIGDATRPYMRAVKVGRRSDARQPTMARIGAGASHMEKPAGWRVIVTKSAESELAAEGRDAPPDVTLDPGIAIIRSVVERAIGYLKQFQMLRMPSLMRDYKRASHCVTLIAGMVNWLIEHNQIENL